MQGFAVRPTKLRVGLTEEVRKEPRFIPNPYSKTERINIYFNQKALETIHLFERERGREFKIFPVYIPKRKLESLLSEYTGLAPQHK